MTLVWMFYSSRLNYHINWIYERALHIVHKDIPSSFDELPGKDDSLRIHNLNLY